MACRIPITTPSRPIVTSAHVDPLLGGSFHPRRRSLQPNAHPHPSNFTSTSSRRATEAPLRAHRDNRRIAHSSLEEFSVLPQDGQWDDVDTWAAMALYLFSLHIPISFGGLGVIAQVLHQPELDQLTKAVSILLLQSTELIGTLAFFKYIKNPKEGLISFFQRDERPNCRSWINAPLVGLAVLFLFAALTSVLFDQLVGLKGANDLALHDVLHSSPAGETICFLVYCFVTPLLEEMVYRGFLLRSLASTMKWQQAVSVSALIFSLAHLSLENTPQLFVVGIVLGCVYCWTGNLASSIIVHSVYNAVILIITGTD